MRAVHHTSIPDCHVHVLGEALNIDPRQFYVQLYGALLQLDTGRPTRNLKCTPRKFTHHSFSSCVSVSSSDDVLLALSCMDKMMRKRRQV